MYQERPVVPGIGKLGHDCSKPGCGCPADVATGAVVEQHADRRQLLERRQRARVGGLQLDGSGAASRL